MQFAVTTMAVFDSRAWVVASMQKRKQNQTGMFGKALSTAADGARIKLLKIPQ